MSRFTACMKSSIPVLTPGSAIPRYTGALLAFLGIALCLANWLSLLIIMVPILWAFTWRISTEEAALCKCARHALHKLHEPHQATGAIHLFREDVWRGRWGFDQARPLASCALLLSGIASAYDNFHVAIYCRAQEVQKMADSGTGSNRAGRRCRVKYTSTRSTSRPTVTASWSTMPRSRRSRNSSSRTLRAGGGRHHLHGERTEPLRDLLLFESRASQGGAGRLPSTPRGISTSSFSTISSSPALKSEYDVAARGARSWTDYRLAIMEDAAKNLVIGPAKAGEPEGEGGHQVSQLVRPFSGAGFQPGARGRSCSTEIYTGHRDPRRGAQRAASAALSRLQHHALHSQNIAPGRNGGGWVRILVALPTTTAMPSSCG